MSNSEINAAEFLQLCESIDRELIVDVRSEQEYAATRLDPSVNIPLESLENRDIYTQLAERAEGATIYLLCGIGMRAARAQGILSARGIDNTRVVEGGIENLQQVLNSQNNEGVQTYDPNGAPD